MPNKTLRSLLLAIVVCCFSCLTAKAQQERKLNQEVKVKTDFRPKINKAKRLSKLPEIVDTAKFTPDFVYAIKTNPLHIDFPPAKIPALRVVGEKPQELHAHNLTLAGGNYATLFGDYRFHHNGSKNIDFGLHLKHYSTNGKLSLADGTKVKPDLTEQLAEIYGLAYRNHGDFSGKLFYKATRFSFYGFPLLRDEANGAFNLFPYENQKLNQFGLQSNYQSKNLNTEALNFGAGLKYEYFSDKINAKEHSIQISGNANIRKENVLLNLASEIDYFAVKGLHFWQDTIKTNNRKTMKWNVNPSCEWQTQKLKLRLGMSAVLLAGDDSKFKLYPDLQADFIAIENNLSLFVGIAGTLKPNSYAEIANENHFIYSGLNVSPLNLKYNLFGGFRAGISPKASFSFKAEYSSIDNQYFFVQASYDPVAIAPDKINGIPFSNKFGVLYDNVNLLKLSAEINLIHNSKLHFNSKLSYQHYALNALSHAWHKPKLHFETTAQYQFTSKLQFSANLNFMDKRPVLRENQTQYLDAVFDLGFGANYQFHSSFSVFGKLNNLFADKYYQWDGYPSQGINGILGVKIRL